VVASYQEAIVDALVRKTAKAAEGMNTLVVGGGVSLNSRLRQRLKEFTESSGKQLLLAEPKYCGDNAAMIAFAAISQPSGMVDNAAQSLSFLPSLRIDD